jgi:hypothetical protein
MPESETPDHDPRFDRAQTISGAKSRYVNLDSYTLAKFESDVERMLREGENPDKSETPLLEGQTVFA